MSKRVKRPLDDRLADKGPRKDVDEARKPLVRTTAPVRLNRPDQLSAATVGLLVMQKVAEFGQTRLMPRTIDAMVQEFTADLTPEEVMRLEVEAYAIVDWLVGETYLHQATGEHLAIREGDHVLYDPKASVRELVQMSLEEEFDLKIDYFSRRRGEMNTRRITPRGIDAEIYLRAYCHSRKAERVFRINRITRAVPIGGRPTTPSKLVRAGQEKEDGGEAPRQISLLDDD